MERYGNKNGQSGVVGFEIGDDFIQVWFQGNEAYVYNEIKPGKAKVDEMKKLAKSGLGLSTYISRIVRNDYFEKA